MGAVWRRSMAPVLDEDFEEGFYVFRRCFGRRTRHLQLVMRGEATGPKALGVGRPKVTLHGVEAFCIELFPREGSLAQSLQVAMKVFANEPAVALKRRSYERHSYAVVARDVKAVAEYLRQLKGEVLGWCGATCVEAFLLFLSAMMSQWCFVSFHRHALQAELALLQPDLLVLADDVEAPEATARMLRPAELRQLTALQHGEAACSPSPKALANLIFTSGSTGTPKAVRRTHEELYAFLWLYAKAVTPDKPCHLAYQPYSHMNEQLGTAVAFLQGSCVAFSSPATAYEDAKAVEPTAIQGVPRFYEPLLHAYESKEASLEELRTNFGGRLQQLSVGSAPVSARLWDFLITCFQSECCSVTNSYGATEVGPIAHNGLINPNVEVKLLPYEDGVGEVLVRCRHRQTQAKGYLGAELGLDLEGFYPTGDLGRFCDGRLELLGRRATTVKLSNGFFVHLERLEERYLSLVPDLDQIFIMASDSCLTAACVQQGHLTESQLLCKMLKAAKGHLADHEAVSKLILESEPWTVGHGLLENMKLDRLALARRYGTRSRAADSMEVVRRRAEAMRRGVQVELHLEALQSDLTAMPLGTMAVARGAWQRVLLTGATGLLGRQLVEALLAHKKQLVALVRTPSDLPVEVQQVVGDLSTPLNLDGVSFDAVWHCAAAVNWAASYEDLRRCNVMGTWQVARLCAQQGLPLFFISTVSAAAVDPARPQGNGYVLSKWVAERFVERSFQMGMRGAIFRPGMLWGSTKTGRCHRDFFPTRFLRACARLGSAPSSLATCDITPVDWAAQTMVKLSLKMSEAPQTFHIYNPLSPNYSQLARLLALEPVHLSHFWSQVHSDPSNPMAPLEPLLQGSLPMASEWGDTNVREVLADGYGPPEVSKELLQTWLGSQMPRLERPTRSILICGG